ncbi:chitobiase/beta-hexosaminidase C-terminal domain-containing protein [Bacillus marinisedimentorum]|uniref:chitobiase/beta-hexosaminidase C-terminal domain-containing protein n=1 Tax=Bacillus marinisedimentorum TaxID=1821260 RepID=UPI0009F2D53B|nr:chitobiase/beta-hexosaminidase C-terminal domain-containing protein [Bacillus marinisedimentorum]
MSSFALAVLLLVSTFAGPLMPLYAEEAPGDLIFSEYVEGSGYNKAIEIYNGTGSSVDLSDYLVELYANGSSVPTGTYNLSGTLESGDVFVIANSQAGEAVKARADAESGITNFNGDDALVLKKQDNVIDSIGQVGVRDLFGADVTLVRMASVTAGDTDPSDAFDRSAQWEVFSKDTFDYLGSYEMPETEPVELQTIDNARQADKGTEVKVQGIVTASFEAGGQTNLFIQDHTAGIIVRGPVLAPKIGDEITAQGEMSSYYGMEQILASSMNVEVVQAEQGVPEAQPVSSADFSNENGEAIEAELVEAGDVEIVSVNQYGDYTARDENGAFLITPEEDNLVQVGETYELVRGVVNYSFGAYKLVPRDRFDVIDVVFSVKADPADGTIFAGTPVELMTAEEGASIHYTLDGTDPTAASQTYEGPIELTENTAVKAVAVRANGETSEIVEFTYKILAPIEEAKIHDIQGAGHFSPYEGYKVEDVEGIVTALDGRNGFYMQEPEPDNDIATSEGIYVYKRGSGVEIGDLVSVTGEVKEWREDGYSDAKDLLTTQITAHEAEVVESGVAVPAPIVIGEDRVPPTEVIEDDEMNTFDPETDGLDFYESLEGMLIQLDDPKITGPEKYDEVPVFVETSKHQLRTDAGGLLISPEDYNPERMLIDVDGYDLNVKTGDYFDGAVTGVVSYDYSNFKIRPVGALPEVVNGGTDREVTKLKGLKPKLTVASYNVENFSAATDPEKAAKIAESIVYNLNTPDIIGLVEMQDNNGPEDDGTVSADKSYQVLIEAIKDAGGAEYAFTDIAPVDKMDGGQPGGNIRVGFLYNPDRVSLPEKPKGDATTAVGVDENGLTLNPGRIDPMNEAFDDSRKSLAAEFEFNGEKVIVIANHFNSKGGDGALFGAEHPVVLGSEVQRLKQAEVINGFVQEILAEDPNANVVVLGDLNDFEFSAPVDLLEGDILTNMMEKLPAEERYTYIYQGNSQVLDHILVSNNLAHRTKIDSVNINSDFSYADGRASDHDPVLAQVHFKKAK